MKINIFIETNNPKIVAELEAMGYKRSTFCNDGKYIFLQNNTIFMVNHAPYVKHTYCGIDEDMFLKLARNTYKQDKQ